MERLGQVVEITQGQVALVELPSEKILLVIFWTNPRNRSGFGSATRRRAQSSQRSSESLTPRP